MFVTVPAQADGRHFASTLALDFGLKKTKLDLLLYFVVLLVIAIIFPLKPD